MVPFKVPESAPLIIEGAQAVKPSITNIGLEQDASAPLKKKVANIEEPKPATIGDKKRKILVNCKVGMFSHGVPTFWTESIIKNQVFSIEFCPSKKNSLKSYCN